MTGEDRQINKEANIMVNAGRKIKQLAGLVGCQGNPSEDSYRNNDLSEARKQVM